jgi:hypothetical protein
MIELDDKWKLVIELNEITSNELGERELAFARSVTRQFQERGDLTQRQWLAIERILQRHRPKHDFDPSDLGSG